MIGFFLYLNVCVEKQMEMIRVLLKFGFVLLLFCDP